MLNYLKKKLSELSYPQLIFIFGCIALILVNAYYLGDNFKENLQKRIGKEYSFVGNYFQALQPALKNEEFIGYYTDRSLSETLNNARFSQAQYVLTPSVLLPNNLEPEYILFDCSSPKIAATVMKKTGVVPITKNNIGAILATKKPWYYR